ncbi:N-6 DNA methylase [Chryseobacterium sp.]|uniref:N-6 DNA methylase n=1 Tax=Chryseobacterium sp. TaxID=1871047 RepID=UPI002FC80A55
MELNNYSQKSKEYEKSLDSTYKKDNGIFYTDIELSQKIIDFLRIPSNAVIMDPCCGTGSFVLAAKHLGYTSIYGADIDNKAVTLSKKECGIENLKVLDTLANDGATVLKKFKLTKPADFVIGNPPYAPMVKDIVIDTSDYLFLRNVKDSGSNLFVAALYRAFDLAKADGVISYIIPKNFLHVASYSVLRKKILNEKTIISIIDIGAYFKSVRGEQIVLTVKNSHDENSDVSIYKYADDNFVKKLEVPQKFYSDEILLFESKEDYNIYQKLESSYKRFNDICTGYVGRGKSTNDDAICGKDIRKFSFKDMPVPKKGNKVFIQNIYSAEAGIIASFAGNLEASETVTVFTDGDEKMCRYILGFLHSRLCNYYLLKFCFNNSKLTMHTDAKYLKKLPLVEKGTTFNQIISIVKSLEIIDYMCDEWFEMVESLNALIYQTYGIDKKECDYIDARMKEIQSQRWNNDKRR